jgi:hypothetical protein
MVHSKIIPDSELGHEGTKTQSFFSRGVGMCHGAFVANLGPLQIDYLLQNRRGGLALHLGLFQMKQAKAWENVFADF